MVPTEVMYEHVRNLFIYDPSTGVLTRRITTSSRAQAGMAVGCRNTAGYLVVNIKAVTGQQLYYIHRIAWLWMTGKWPLCIDHINGDRADNRWKNLRDVDWSDNLHNKQGASGVYWARRDKVWIASIQDRGMKIHIGQHKDRAQAEQMYATYKKRYLP